MKSIEERVSDALEAAIAFDKRNDVVLSTPKFLAALRASGIALVDASMVPVVDNETQELVDPAYVRVPREPTEAMINDGLRAYFDTGSVSMIYKTMIAAAIKPQGGEG